MAGAGTRREQMEINDTTLADVIVVTPSRFGDTSGFFSGSCNQRAMGEHGLEYNFRTGQPLAITPAWDGARAALPVSA